MATSRSKNALERLVADSIRDILAQVSEVEDSLKAAAQKRLSETLQHAAGKLTQAAREIDPIKEPSAFFDPADPRTLGRLAAVALLVQPRLPLAMVERAYGSGVYAIYYDGAYPAYRSLAKTESPIYVGKADPETPDAHSPRQQGTKLTDRLSEHRRTIRKTEIYARENGLKPYIAVDEFFYRKLVVGSTAHLAAEQQLINLFQPIWNSEVNISFGMAKHGDAAETRGNLRSPWHTLHPGVGWALARKLQDAKTIKQINDEIAAHINKYQPFKTSEKAIAVLIRQFRQDLLAAGTPEDGEAD
jgi:hypothetical protein